LVIVKTEGILGLVGEGPAAVAVAIKLKFSVAKPEVAEITMAPTVLPAVTVMDAWPFDPVVVDQFEIVAVP
jgi:hypothetical protein